jgi:hypothetical protein
VRVAPSYTGGRAVYDAWLSSTRHVDKRAKYAEVRESIQNTEIAVRPPNVLTLSCKSRPPCLPHSGTVAAATDE